MGHGGGGASRSNRFLALVAHLWGLVQPSSCPFANLLTGTVSPRMVLDFGISNSVHCQERDCEVTYIE